jgi:RNA polymerase sigma-70 factor, ECF subfamily
MAPAQSEPSPTANEADWARLYQLHAGALFRFLLRLTGGNRGEAEDHLQETFLRAWRAVTRQPLDLETIRPWLFTVARRIAIDATRAKQIRPTEVIVAELARVAGADNEIERLVQVEAVRGALLSLREEHRSALIELFYNERTAKEAASVLGVPEGTVKSRVHYGLQALRKAAVAADRERPARLFYAKPGRDRPASARPVPARAA